MPTHQTVIRGPLPHVAETKDTPQEHRDMLAVLPTSHMGRRHLSPETYQNSSARQSMDNRRQDYYGRDRDRPHSPHRGEMSRDNQHYTFSPDRHPNYSNEDMPRPHYGRPSGNLAATAQVQ